MTIYEKEARFKLGPIPVGTSLGDELSSKDTITFRAGRNIWGNWISEVAWVKGPNTVNYEKHIYFIEEPGVTEEIEEAAVDVTLTRDEINRHSVVGKRLHWEP